MGPSASAADRVERSVLVVEDDPMVAEVLFDLLSSLGYSVLSASDGNDAVSLYRAAHDDVDCIILDFDLPGLHSSRVLRRLLEIDRNVRVLLSSGYSQSDIRGAFPLDRVDAFIPKPFDPEMLISELRGA